MVEAISPVAYVVYLRRTRHHTAEISSTAIARGSCFVRAAKTIRPAD